MVLQPLPNFLHGRATQVQFASQLGGGDALEDATQEQDHLGRPKVSAFEDRPGVERVGACPGFAAIDIEVTAPGTPEQVGFVRAAARAAQAVGVKVFHQPGRAQVFVEKVYDWKVHADNLRPCTLSEHEPRSLMIRPLLFISRFVLAGIFFLSSIGKILDSSTAVQLAQLLFSTQGSEAVLRRLVYGLSVLEAGLGLWLIWGYALRESFRAIGMVLGLFSVLLLYLLIRGAELDTCGCLGTLFSSGTLEDSLLRNLGLLGIVALGIFFLDKGEQSSNNEEVGLPIPD